MFLSLLYFMIRSPVSGRRCRPGEYEGLLLLAAAVSGGCRLRARSETAGRCLAALAACGGGLDAGGGTWSHGAAGRIGASFLSHRFTFRKNRCRDRQRGESY